jgi:hypothetical protein
MNSSNPRLVYLLAASHSGSTLTAMLLGRHPEVCTVGELKATSLGDVRRYRCSCRETLATCSFWLAISRQMKTRGFQFDVADAGTDYRARQSRFVRCLLDPLHRGMVLEWVRDRALALSPAWRSALPRIQSRNAALVESIVAQTGKSIVVDSSKVGIRLKFLLRNPALDVWVIRVIRDGRGVALTYTDPAQYADAQTPCFRGGGSGENREAERLSLADAAHEWRRSNEEAETLIRGLEPARCIMVRYEDLCVSTDLTLNRMWNFLGVSPLPLVRLPHPDYHIIGNGMRMDWNGDIRHDERWRSVLSNADLRVFDSIAGNTNRRLGYN